MKKRTGTSVQAVVGASDLDGGLVLVDDPVLGTSAVAVVAVRIYERQRAPEPDYIGLHLDGSAVGHNTTLDIETLGSVAVRVDLVGAGSGGWRRRRRGRRATSGTTESLLDGSVEAAVVCHRASARARFAPQEVILTVGGGSIPHHDTTERRVLVLRRLDDGRESADRDVASASSAGASSNTDVDLDILVGGLSLCPGVPEVEVPVSGDVVVLGTTVVVVCRS